jgi:EH_Signature domain
MISIQEALRGIEAQQQSMLRSSLAFPLDMKRECKRLEDTAREFTVRASQPKLIKHPLDPDKVWRDWESQRFSASYLDARQIKTLCFAPDKATRPELIGMLQQDGEALKRTACLVAVIQSYFARWGKIREQEKLESLITKALTAYPRRNPLVLAYRENAALLFQPRAASGLAGAAIDGRDPPRKLLERFHVGLATNLGVETLGCAVRQFWTWSAIPVGETEANATVRYAVDSLFVPELRKQELQHGVSKLILCDWVERYSACHHMVRQYVLHHPELGDPRLRAANWAGMDSSATARFLKWIAKESIVFFFNHVLPDNSANERRKNFWLEYAGSVKDFQVALSERDYNRLYASARLRDVPGFGRVEHQSTSAFVMRFGVRGGEDIIIVEFSETGNAAHTFTAAAFERKAGSLRNSRFDFSKLKHRANDDRILHLGAWEYYARNKLAEWGVRI